MYWLCTNSVGTTLVRSERERCRCTTRARVPLPVTPLRIGSEDSTVYISCSATNHGVEQVTYLQGTSTDSAAEPNLSVHARCRQIEVSYV